jgi:DNA-directed RNA polymerase specialized sigma24 family protein
MADVSLDDALPVVQTLARRKASAFVHRCRIAIDEREDIESQLLLTFLTRWPKYDSERASIQTFASRIFDAQLNSILRYRLAQCRQWRELPVPHTGPTAESIHQFRLDLDRVMSTMPEVFRETVSALSWLSAVEASNVLGCSRQTINIRKHQIRKAFIATGITSDYFARQ